MPSLSSLIDIANYHADAKAALHLRFSTADPNYDQRFQNYSQSEIDSELISCLDETSLRSSLITLARVEAALRVDYRARCKLKKADAISISFRKIYKNRADRARLDEDIIQIWSDNIIPSERAILSKLRGMYKFRHWLAHGRYWILDHNYIFEDVYLISYAIINNLPLYS